MDVSFKAFKKQKSALMKCFKALIDRASPKDCFIKRNKSNTDNHESAVTDGASTDDSDERTNGT